MEKCEYSNFTIGMLIRKFYYNHESLLIYDHNILKGAITYSSFINETNLDCMIRNVVFVNSENEIETGDLISVYCIQTDKDIREISRKVDSRYSFNIERFKCLYDQNDIIINYLKSLNLSTIYVSGNEKEYLIRFIKMYGLPIEVKEINEFLINRKISAITEVYNYYMDSLSLEEFKNVNFSNVGLIVVRPECFAIRKKYRNFLEKNGLEILYEEKFQLDFRQYFLLYYESFILEDTMLDFPSRTFNYINNDCYLFVVIGNNQINVSDYLCSIKGKQGRYEPGTLRGDLAYSSLKNNIMDGILIKDAIIPLDPIGTARMITRDKVWHDGSHSISDIPLLFYCGQAVHVPNSKEIKKDIVTLCDEEIVKKVLRKCR